MQGGGSRGASHICSPYCASQLQLPSQKTSQPNWERQERKGEARSLGGAGAAAEPDKTRTELEAGAPRASNRNDVCEGKPG